MNRSEVENTAKLSWRVHPAAERKGVAILICCLIFVLGLLTTFWMANIYWGFFAFVLLFLSLEAFFLPSRFELGESGVTTAKVFSTSIEKPWDYYRRVTFTRREITLSPFRRRNWLDNYRSTRLVFSRIDDPDAPGSERVQEYILQHIDHQKVIIEGLGKQQKGSMDAEIPGALDARK